MGRLDEAEILRPVGRTTPVRPDTTRHLAEHLMPAGPGHAWEGVRFATSWGSRAELDIVLLRALVLRLESVKKA